MKGCVDHEIAVFFTTHSRECEIYNMDGPGVMTTKKLRELFELDNWQFVRFHKEATTFVVGPGWNGERVAIPANPQVQNFERDHIFISGDNSEALREALSVAKFLDISADLTLAPAQKVDALREITPHSLMVLHRHGNEQRDLAPNDSLELFTGSSLDAGETLP